MKTYNTLFETMLEAANTCRLWESPRQPGVTYNVEELSEVACIHDMNYPLDSPMTQYAAFPDGEMCLINFETGVTALLFRPVQQAYQQPVQQTAYQQPVQQPVYQQPQQQAYQQPVQQPVYQQPVQQPVYQQPVYQQPVQQPVYQQPVQQAYQQPVQQAYQQPVQQPVYQQPVQQAYQQPVQQPQQPAQQPAQPVWTFCPECGCKLRPGAAACDNCGMPLR